MNNNANLQAALLASQQGYNLNQINNHEMQLAILESGRNSANVLYNDLHPLMQSSTDPRYRNLLLILSALDDIKNLYKQIGGEFPPDLNNYYQRVKDFFDGVSTIEENFDILATYDEIIRNHSELFGENINETVYGKLLKVYNETKDSEIPMLMVAPQAAQAAPVEAVAVPKTAAQRNAERAARLARFAKGGRYRTKRKSLRKKRRSLRKRRA